MNPDDIQTSEIFVNEDSNSSVHLAKSPRGYDNSQRQAKAIRNQELILKTLAELLIATDGREVPFDLISG